ncbi:hypothetical protein F5B22DRAFT_636609 [Xylaria bambusicola]|uniref:uncharacterized protein n=1 Tax=Xylaria bambusicola TaxID=326684 RepID=UPI0020085944|nr:uncharacterized protein F5B22DRAFT_636609 [Xylaria bambusicola]KAI0515329.1 hypothetical protein F5B22DRAFT_636609 [Xylaria bambusicola]
MARPLFHNIFLRLPPGTAVLLLSFVFSPTEGHALPQQTKVVAFRELDVIPFPPLPTDQPLSPFDLQRRQENTVCGYLGGDSNLPATCSAGSHCVLDQANSVVGCCPNGGACTTGVFTGCVDRNSDPQTEINPYVYTCQGSDVCFLNNFAGGYSQYGCGTASTIGTSVETSAEGATKVLSITTVDVSLTESPSTLATPTKIGSTATSSDSTSTSSSASSHTKSSTTHSSSSTSPTKTPSSTPTNTDAPPSTGQTRTGVIIGGVVGGAAALIALAALGLFCLRRRNQNHRIGPGPAPKAPPTTHYTSPIQSHGAAFAPLPSWNDEDGSPPPPTAHNHAHPYPPEPYVPLERTRSAVSSHFRTHSDPHPPDSYGPLESTLSTPTPANLASVHGYLQPMRYNPGYPSVAMPPPKGSLTPVVEEDQPLEREESQGREIDDFSRAYSSAEIGQLTDEDVEEDRTPLRANPQDMQQEGDSTRRTAGNRPLWQQNRQQSRNLMWL